MRVSPEDRARGEDRRRARDRQPEDPLRRRAKSVAYWRRMQQTNPNYCESQCWALYRNASFRRYLMPRLRAWLDAKDRAHREAFAEYLAQHSREWEQNKAQRKAEKVGQPDLFRVAS